MFDMRRYLLAAIIAIVLCAAFASSDEYHQTFVEGRTGQIKDVIIDTSGAVTGALLYGTYYITYRMGYRRHITELKEEKEEANNKKSKKKN